MKKNNKQILIILTLAIVITSIVILWMSLQMQGPKATLPQTEKTITVVPENPDGGGSTPDQI
jgi:hypothetical protein